MRKSVTKGVAWFVLLAMVVSFQCGRCSRVKIHHVILVWFPETTTQDEIDLIKEETERLKEIPGVLSVSVGSPLESTRPVVDDTFDLGVVMEFASTEEMNHYLADEAHQKFLQRHIQGKTEKLLIYDFQSSR